MHESGSGPKPNNALVAQMSAVERRPDLGLRRPRLPVLTDVVEKGLEEPSEQ
jgi:hypothetical protein